MKFFSVMLPLALVATVSSVPMAVRKRDVNPNLVPQFGFQSGVNPTGTGDCDGAVNDASGQPIKIPCSCPPDRTSFIQELNANVAVGHVLNNPTVQLSFPEDNSTASQLARLNAAAVTLQNLNGPGKGCPIVSTTFSAQQKAIEAKASGSSAATPAVSSALIPPPPPSPISQLAPNLGFSAGLNPTGTGDCDGAVNGADGKPIKIPCACPPTQDVFIQAHSQHLVSDVQAGHAVNNPTVHVSFPTDGSVASQLARINTALVTIQNLNGPGKGCPAVSTTLQAQQKALQAQQ
ncbi:hypothetical protein K488DRAFT_43823 [Vararia minispora EC-137]|uniref:Uncharacterized protein n=1 Tax=Vararia minispora EC-137 TaxID=1314806 RepID=A0ACB8QUC4_9AGAM|nr:hypothetical protein K488DRAFT_43823 [Vararia minispora EC-137]